MNKQQLASKIWESANKMRSKIEANEYKDYILGFIFYKFLSDKEEKSLINEGWTLEDLKELKEEDLSLVKYCQNKFGYFISHDFLFSFGCPKEEILTFQMLEMVYPHLTV
jgi:type I restriction enzyme M protein